MKFQIEYIAPSLENTYVLARQLEAGDFSLSSSAQLGGVSVKRQLSMPRRVLHDGTPDLTVFVFTLANGADRSKFSVGQEVELCP